MNGSDKPQTNTVIAELKVIFSNLVLCLMSIQSDINLGTQYLNCTNTESVIDVSANIQHKIGILKDFLTSIQKVCKHLNPSCVENLAVMRLNM